MNGKSLSFVCFSSVHSVTLCILPLALREWQTFHLDPPDWPHWWQWKIPHQCEMLPWFQLSWDPWLRVTGTGWISTPPPLCTVPLFCGSMPQPCAIMSADLLTQSQHYCVQRLHREHSIFTLLPYAWVGLGGAVWWTEGRRAKGGGGMMMQTDGGRWDTEQRSCN